MSDLIQLLPESVANQIAAGEVVQRPASAVKEMIENSIDANSGSIHLLVKDAGKTLIQVIDNGKGMSEQDARMCFERHATSKIKTSEDLFSIATKGFRGEALASIASIAQVELRTRLHGAALGTKVSIEGSKIKSVEQDQCPEGTNLSIKNLFFNVPARRYFLKSDAVELKHIIDEVHRIALTHPDVEFKMTHNGAELFHYPKTTIRQRIVHILGSKYNEKLVPVEEETDIVTINGFVGKPDTAKRTRGEQFFFVNQRFIKSSYLHHAVMGAFEQLLGEGHFPLYLLYLEIDPALIDINIHPTKTEIKFQDERAIYAILHAAVKRALGRHNITPTLDFNQEVSIPIEPISSGREVKMPEIKINPDYNPFPIREKREGLAQGWTNKDAGGARSHWQELMEISRMIQPDEERITPEERLFEPDEEFAPVQMHRKYIMTSTSDGYIVIDQQRAHRRILFERFLAMMEGKPGNVQQLLFPEIVHLSSADSVLMNEIIEDVRAIGFEIESFGGSDYQVSGIPAESSIGDIQRTMEGFIEQVKNEQGVNNEGHREKIAWAMASGVSVRYGQMLTLPEMKEMIDALLACAQPNYERKNKPTFLKFSLEQISQQFR